MDAYILDTLNISVVFLLFQGIQVACEVVLRKVNVGRNTALHDSGFVLGLLLCAVGPSVENRMFPGQSVERPAKDVLQFIDNEKFPSAAYIGGALLLVTATRLRIRSVRFLRLLKSEIAAGKGDSALISLIDREALLMVTESEVQEFANTSVEVRTKLKEAAMDKA